MIEFGWAVDNFGDALSDSFEGTSRHRTVKGTCKASNADMSLKTSSSENEILIQSNPDYNQKPAAAPDDASENEYTTDRIHVVVGDREFILSRHKILQYPDTLLAQILTEKTTRTDLVFDRAPEVFKCIANYYRCGKLHLRQSICPKFVKEELEFWRISEKALSPCCRLLMIKSEQERIHETKMEQKFHWSIDLDLIKNVSASTRAGKCSEIIFKTLDDASYSILSSLYGTLYLICVFLSFVTFVSRTVDEFQIAVPDANVASHANSSDGGVTPTPETVLPDFVLTNPKAQRIVRYQLHPVLHWIDFSCSIVFIVDLTLRIVFCPKRIRFIRTLPTIIDLVATTGTIARMVIRQKYWTWFQEDFGRLLLFELLDVLKLMRAIRVLKFTSKYSGLRVLIIALRDSVGELLLLINFLLIGMILFSVLMYYAEFTYKESQFTNVPVGFWWAIITMTTVGYGDFYPKTLPGFVAGSLCALTGLIFIALPIPVVSNNFTYLYQYANQQQLREKAEHKIKVLSFVEIGAGKMVDGFRKTMKKKKQAEQA